MIQLEWHGTRWNVVAKHNVKREQRLAQFDYWVQNNHVNKFGDDYFLMPWRLIYTTTENEIQ